MRICGIFSYTDKKRSRAVHDQNFGNCLYMCCSRYNFNDVFADENLGRIVCSRITAGGNTIISSGTTVPIKGKEKELRIPGARYFLLGSFNFTTS